jgi:hypothetical protein
MARYWQLLVKAQGDTKGANRAMRDLRRSTRRLQQAVGVDFGRIAKVSAVALGAGLAASVRTGVNELRESAKVSAQLDTALRNNGRNAGVTAAEIDRLAASLSYKAAVDDELIASAVAQSLAFRNVRNQAGAGNDIFTRLTKTSLDYARATNKDVVQSQIKFARALNQPEKAAKLLRGAGVTLTKQQEEQVKAFAASGNVLGAQRFILAELEKRYRGAAAAAGNASPFERLRETFNNLTATIVGGVGKGFGGFLNNLSAAMLRMDQFFKSAQGQQVLAQVSTELQRLGSVLMSAMQAAGQFAALLFRYRDVLIPIGAGILAVAAALKAYRVAVAAAAVAQNLLNVAQMANPIGLIVLAVVGLVAAMVVLYKRSETFRNIVNAIGAAFKRFGVAAMQVLRDAWQKAQPLVNILKLIARLYIRQLVMQFQVVKAVALAVWAGIKSAWGKAVNLFNGVRAAIGIVVSAFQRVRSAIAGLPEKAGEIGRAIVDGIKRGIGNGAEALVKYVRDLGGRLLKGVKDKLGIKSPSRVFARQVGQPIAEGIAAGIRANIEKASKAMDALAERMANSLRKRLQRSDLRQAFLDYRMAEAKFTGAETTGILKQQLQAVLQRIAILKSFLRRNARKLRAEAKLDLLNQLTGLLDNATDLRTQLQDQAAAAPVTTQRPVTMPAAAPSVAARTLPGVSGGAGGNTYNVTVNAQQPVDSVAFMRSLRVAARLGTV